MVSTNKNPKGLSGSIWSKMSFVIASSGMDRNMPDIPHKAFPANTTMIENNALIFTFEETMIGTMQFFIGSCHDISVLYSFLRRIF